MRGDVVVFWNNFERVKGLGTVLTFLLIKRSLFCSDKPLSLLSTIFSLIIVVISKSEISVVPSTTSLSISFTLSSFALNCGEKVLKNCVVVTLSGDDMFSVTDSVGRAT